MSVFAASIDPSAEPAPMRLWSSSINRMMSSALMTSSIAALMRSSKSPLYFVPATIPVISNAMIRIFLIVSGISSVAILRAIPSAMAVLPTPGSPTRQGLFFVRLLKICTTLSISCSLPMTGSIKFWRASAVKSLPNLSRVGVAESLSSAGVSHAGEVLAALRLFMTLSLISLGFAPACVMMLSATLCPSRMREISRCSVPM